MYDLYGMTKSLGEPEDCMVLRTSFIGPELHSHVSLMDWVKSNEDCTINGYTNHLWNGVTTKQFSDICKKIIQEDLYSEETFHVFSPDIVSKSVLVNMIAKKLKISVNIIPIKTPIGINRSLSSIKDLNSSLNIPTLTSQVEIL